METLAALLDWFLNWALHVTRRPRTRETAARTIESVNGANARLRSQAHGMRPASKAPTKETAR